VTAAAAAPSEVVSRYLEALYYIAAERMSARPARLADWLGVSRPTVTVALQRMVRDGLVELSPAKVIVLTDRGARAAAALVRRHRILERWLTDQLGMDWIAADEEAARLEHAASDEVVDRVHALLGAPLTCPHGNPIPGSAELDPREMRVSELPPGSTARLTRISEVAEREAPLLLAELLERRLVPTALIGVLEVDAQGGMMRINLDGRARALTQETASKLWAVIEVGPLSIS